MNSDDRERIYIAKHYISCLACLLAGHKNSHADYHHVVEGNKRLGHQYGLPLCLWHHRGERDPVVQGVTHEEIEKSLGPSLKSKRRFIDRFGEERMLVDLTDYAIDLFNDVPWNEFDMPESVAAMIKRRWKFLIWDQNAPARHVASLH